MNFVIYLIAPALLFFIFVIPKIKNKYLLELIFAIPVLNALADVTTNYFSPNAFLTTGVIRTFIIILLIYLYAGNIVKNKINMLILFFLAYLNLLLPFSSDPLVSFMEYIKVFISLLMFLVGYSLIKNPHSLSKLNKYVTYAVVVIIGQIIIAQIFQIGLSEYVADSFYIGGGLVQITYSLVIFIIVSPIIKKYSKGKRQLFVNILLISSVIVILIILRRISIAAIIVGTIVYLVFSPQKLSNTKKIIAGICILLLSFPIWQETFTERFDARSKSFEELEQESRFVEITEVYIDLSNSNFLEILVGKEIFNSANYFLRNVSFGELGGIYRQLHTDYMVLLHGTGVIGLLFYLYIHLRWFLKVFYHKTKNVYGLELRAIFVTLLVVSLLISFSGSISTIGYRSLLMLYLGAIYSLLVNRRY
ncbi:MAG: hypothetical protein RIC57_06710 [Balneola sp.]